MITIFAKRIAEQRQTISTLSDNLEKIADNTFGIQPKSNESKATAEPNSHMELLSITIDQLQSEIERLTAIASRFMVLDNG